MVLENVSIRNYLKCVSVTMDLNMARHTVRIVVFHCHNLSLFQRGEQRAFLRSWPGVKLVAIPCSGKMEAHHLLKTLAAGADGVLVLACEEASCRYLEGSNRSHKRFDYARSWLTKIGLNKERIAFRHILPRDKAALEAALKHLSRQLGAVDGPGAYELCRVSKVG